MTDAGADGGLTLRLQRLGTLPPGGDSAGGRRDPAAQVARLMSAVDVLDEAVAPVGAPSEGLTAPGAVRARGVSALGRAPEPTADLVGRGAEIDQLADRVRFHSGLGPALLAVTGPEGSGRTAVALALARLLAEERPGGVLQTSLRTARGAQADPADVLARFLGALGAPSGQIPFAVDESAAALRRLLLRRPAVLVLDDADDPALLDPLVPQAPGSVIILTARSAQPRAHAEVCLGPLTPDASLDLLTRQIGSTRLACDPAAAHALVTGACGGWPMAVRLAGALLEARPRWSVTEVTERMAASAEAAASLRHGEAPVRAAFACAYGELSRPAARLFRLLALVPGDEATPELAAALTGARLAETITACDELRQAALIESGRHLGRFRLHPLLRRFADTLLVRSERLDEQAQARRRLIAWYLDAVHAAVALTGTARAGGWSLPQSPVGGPGRALRPFDDEAGARAWALEEGGCVLEAARIAAAYGMDVSACALAVPAGGLVERTVPWLARLLYETGVRGAVRAEEPAHAGSAWLRLGRLLGRAGHREEAARALHAALDIGRRLEDPRLTGVAAAALAGTHADEGHVDQALHSYEDALRLHEEAGAPPSARAALWSRIGRLHADASRYDDAATAYERALALHEDPLYEDAQYEDRGDEGGRARLLLALAAVAAAAGRDEQAMRASRGAVASFHALGDAFLHACALMQLSELLAGVPDPIASGVCRREALAIAAGLPPARALAVERLAGRTASAGPDVTGGSRHGMT